MGDVAYIVILWNRYRCKVIINLKDLKQPKHDKIIKGRINDLTTNRKHKMNILRLKLQRRGR